MWLRIALILSLWASLVCAASVQWNASIVDAEHGAPDGYRVYYGSASDQLTTVWDNGGSTVFDIPDMWAVGTYYFGVRAYNAYGESGWATTPEGQTWVSYVKADPPPVEPPELATDVRIVWEPIEEPPIMATHVQSRGTLSDDTTSISYNFASNVTSGNLLIIGVVSFTFSTDDPPAVGDISKSAGTATLGTFTLDKVQTEFDGTFYQHTAIFSVPVTGTGSCTIQVSGAPSGSYFLIGLSEFSGVDTGVSRVEDSASGQNATGAPSSGDADSVAGGVFFGLLAINTGSVTAVTPDTLFNQIYESEDGSNHMVGSFIYRIASGALTDSASWTEPTNRAWAAALAVYKNASGGGSSAVPVIMRSYRARRN